VQEALGEANGTADEVAKKREEVDKAKNEAKDAKKAAAANVKT